MTGGVTGGVTGAGVFNAYRAQLQLKLPGNKKDHHHPRCHLEYQGDPYEYVVSGSCDRKFSLV